MNSTLKKSTSSLLGIELVDSDVQLYLTLASNPEKKYEISEFDIYFSQPTDHKGQPQHETNGGIIEFSIKEIPDEALNKWMLNSTMQLSGQFSFERKAQSSVLKILFTDSFCVYYDKMISTGGALTRLRISPEIVNINGSEKLKIWAR